MQSDQNQLLSSFLMWQDKLKYYKNLVTSKGTITHIPTNLHQFLISSISVIAQNTDGKDQKQ